VPPPPALPPEAPKAPEVKVIVPPVKVEVKDHIDEPPLAPSPGPVVVYRVTSSGETFKTLARKTLGTAERWSDIHKLNPAMTPDRILAIGTMVRLPGDACVADEDTVKPLPSLRNRAAGKVKATLPLTGTYPVTLDKSVMTLPSAILQQLGHCDTVMVSPGSDRCLWLTNQAHLDRLAQKLEKSPARENDKSSFKRLYYAQTVKVPVKEDGRVAISEKLATFAGLHQEVVLVGIDDHFEVWDAARWRRYTQARKAALSGE
jgi:MraZ protein